MLVGRPALTSRERLVLYGLVRWPHLGDVGLGEVLGLGRTTVTVIRRRLVGHGLVEGFLVPDFGRVGCELLTALYGEFSGAASHGLDAFKAVVRDGVGSAFYMVRFGGQHLSLGAARNLTQVGEAISAHHRVHHESGYLTDRRHNYVFFPLKLTNIPRFFDYAPLLAKEFGLEYRPDRVTASKAVDWKPTRRERGVYTALVSLPEASDEKVAAKAGVSRQTVNVLRNRFLGSGLLRPLKIPDVSRLGFGLLAFTHLHMSPHVGRDGRKKHTESVLEDCAHVLKVSGDLESVLLSFHKDYGDYRRSHERLLGVYRKNRLLSDDPVVKLFPLLGTDQLLNHRYGNVLSGFGD